MTRSVDPTTCMMVREGIRIHFASLLENYEGVGMTPMGVQPYMDTIINKYLHSLSFKALY
jgi:hypothetical protein